MADIFQTHDDVIKWKQFPRYWPFVRGIHRSPVNSPQKAQWRRALMFLLICAWRNGWVNNREAGDLRRHRTHYDVTVMMWPSTTAVQLTDQKIQKHFLSLPHKQALPWACMIECVLDKMKYTYLYFGMVSLLPHILYSISTVRNCLHRLSVHVNRHISPQSPGPCQSRNGSRANCNIHWHTLFTQGVTVVHATIAI